MWTDHAVNSLVELWNRGDSASVISESFHRDGEISGEFSRAAIVGKVLRLRQKGYILRGSTRKDRATREISRTSRQSNRNTHAEVKTYAPPKDPMPEMEMALQPLIHSIVDLEDHHCKYMHGDALDGKYCGRSTVHGGSWCENHRKRVWTTADQR